MLKRFYPVILVTLVILSSVVLLSVTDTFARDKIKAQQEAQTKSMLQAMFPSMTDYSLNNDMYILTANGSRIGYAFLATGRGYGGAISILVGLENETTVKGISIISQTETAGLGARIALPSFTDRFAGQKIDDIKLKQDGGQIDATTGSTISCRAVVEAVRNTALEKAKMLPK